MAFDACRSQRLLQEGPCGDVRLLHRRSDGDHALRRCVPGDAHADDDREAARAGRHQRYRDDDELRFRSVPLVLEPVPRLRICGHQLGCEDRGGRRRLPQDPLHVPGVFPQTRHRPEALGRASGSFARRLRCPDEARSSVHRRQGLHVRLLQRDRRSADPRFVRG